MELKGAEILAEGVWNGTPFKSEHLDGLVASFDALGLAGRVPLKLGHGGLKRENDAQPALGWVTRIYRDGKKLLADFSDVPKVIYEAIRKGLYKHVSVELLRDVKADTRKIPFVLDAVALLGATQPAVGILKDLQQLTMTRGTGLQAAGRLTFKQLFNGGHDMDDEIAALRAQLAEQNKMVLDMTFDSAVRDGRCLPRERVQFAKRYGDAGTLADATQWIQSAQKPPGRSPSTRSTSAAEVQTHDRADDEVGARVKLLMKARREEGEPAISQIDATVLVLRADPALAESYKNLHGIEG